MGTAAPGDTGQAGVVEPGGPRAGRAVGGEALSRGSEHRCRLGSALCQRSWGWVVEQGQLVVQGPALCMSCSRRGPFSQSHLRKRVLQVEVSGEGSLPRAGEFITPKTLLGT